MQLTRAEIAETQVIVTTPEKWDVITRKGGDNSLVEKVKLLILDEVHLLASDRGNVVESMLVHYVKYPSLIGVNNRLNQPRLQFVLLAYRPPCPIIQMWRNSFM